MVADKYPINLPSPVLDHFFLDLAISYLGRNDLAHVEPADITPYILGTGDGQGDLPGLAVAETMRRFASKGYVRNQLLVVNGGAANGTTGMSVGTVTQSSTTVTASGVSQELAGSTGSAEAYAVAATVVRQVDSRLARVREARRKGTEGEDRKSVA